MKSFLRTIAAFGAICGVATTAEAQMSVHTGLPAASDSSYPESNQQSAPPNEPDHTYGSAHSTYNLPSDQPVPRVSGTKTPAYVNLGHRNSSINTLDTEEQELVPSTNDVSPAQTMGNQGIITTGVPGTAVHTTAR